ncbi:protein PYRICULARIA ORYZAE RESISTANCE 21-like [Phalaenopsis equestris]|uniref:protein PYRICULARIA ORYZAE RESISTANCE 21-like n=1 Tax=Phalaenopsis equestris TaxID=78828 RepID=UPI0009E65475|nr:protein PYRICULARIA ORYZAE RESISTANCE 21-like [Phalaenopsis equestris]
MTGEISTIILTVHHLECHRCFKKIKNVICKLQDKVPIEKVAYDEKNRTVTISGPFDPICVKKKLCCKARKLIVDISIPQDNKPDGDGGNKPGENKPPSPEPEKKCQPVYLPILPVGLTGGPTLPVCCGRRCYGWCNDSCRCCYYGCWMVCPPSLPAVGKPVTYQFSCDYEQVPNPCSVM